MKIALKVRSLLILLALSALYTGCKKDDDDSKTLEQQQLEKLVFDWNLQSATDSQGDRTADFTNLVLHLSGNYTGEGKIYNYSFTGQLPDSGPTSSPWPRSGTWKFGTDKSKDIIRDPGGASEIAMEYTVTATDLIITFEVPDGGGWPGGRIQNVTGEWTFTFTR